MIRLKLWLGAALGVVLAVLGAWVAGMREGRQAGRVKALRREAKQHEAMNEADIGIGASDADNLDWLRKFHDRNKR